MRRPGLPAAHTVGSQPLPDRIARGARYGVRQPCCRASRAHDPARGTALTLLATGMLCVLITIVESVRLANDHTSTAPEREYADPAFPLRTPWDHNRYRTELPVARSMECNSRAAAAALLSITCVYQRFPHNSRRQHACRPVRLFNLPSRLAPIITPSAHAADGAN
ncbi:MAG: hypothetical protein KatS3mg056_3817 [Chloroflexus sp.]|jgi:hypothetical protein|nr:MAG: hypothetical protein KatS3mg056_3817 [Chloroflexus sp.]